MRLGIRTKQIAGVTTIIAVTVVALSALYVTQLAEAVLGENEKLAQLLAKQIYQRAFEVARQAAADPYEALRQDPGLRSILQSTVYGDVLSGAAIIDTNGLVVASDDESLIGMPLRPRPELAALIAAGAIEQIRMLYSGEGETFEYRQRMTDSSRGDEEFGSIRIGVQTVFVRNATRDLLQRALLTGAVVLLVAVIVAGLLSQLLLRPIHQPAALC
jgi:hypothetical protein